MEFTSVQIRFKYNQIELNSNYLIQLEVLEQRDQDGNIAKFHICLNPHNLNNLLEDTDHFLLPLIADILEKTMGHKYFITLDLKQAYH